MVKAASATSPAARTRRNEPRAVTIGGLARAAGVGVETVRYYQRRQLLAVPQADGSIRRYPPAMVQRIRFIKRSQSLGFSLDEIRELLLLEQGGKRREIRAIARHRLGDIREKIVHLERMEQVLSQLVRDCEHSQSAAQCPIIAALSGRLESQSA
jgi:MerR family mercuric resistance operon transcriptional regulator